ncbi:pyridoxal-phosphate dependent enzyme [Streptomyces sp. H39-S7]|uniref:pyridoxal-phosphate dependent enzyme n=1 Tax=Streptomyces sp. H39-S7 TaxID=3004357 RepID=UPI0022AF1F72|nr:pyridoxal-phosphate dependent enzyme [Streptomyces sp. H39-S7]MCZ4119717.1 pyridoxal-phosphate dependent enzyme [Streptomyces sp. H39-S7]
MTTSDSRNASRALLATWPTPLEPMPRLARALGLGPDDLWVKRDDLIGLGGGGNKVRKLEWLCGAARDVGATVLVTTGAPQSNHARLTAAAAARLGLDAVLVLRGTPGASGSGNLTLDALFGATVVWAGEVGAAELKAVAGRVAGELRERGAVPALIPFGGSSAVGALGYVECGRELLAQAPDLSTVVVALGSGGTMAGLVDSLGSARVLGIHVGAVEDPSRTVSGLVAELSGEPGGPGTLRVRLDQVGEGYGTLTEPVMAALLLAAGTEGMVLDPIYTGRAMAGLIAAVEDGGIVPGQRTVFLHSGGLPGLYGHPQTLARAAAALTTATGGA